MAGNIGLSLKCHFNIYFVDKVLQSFLYLILKIQIQNVNFKTINLIIKFKIKLKN